MGGCMTSGTSQQSSTNSMAKSHSIGCRSDSIKCQATSSLQKALDMAKEHAYDIKYGTAMPLESVKLLGKLIGEN